MGVWSAGDLAATEEEAMTGSVAFVAGPWRYEWIEGAGRWLQLDAPDQVNRLLLDFLSGVPADAARGGLRLITRDHVEPPSPVARGRPGSHRTAGREPPWTPGASRRLHAGAVDVGLTAAGALQGAVPVGAYVQMPGIVLAGL